MAEKKILNCFCKRARKQRFSWKLHLLSSAYQIIGQRWSFKLLVHIILLLPRGQDATHSCYLLYGPWYHHLPCIIFARKSLPYRNGTSILHYVILFIATSRFVRERSIKHFCWKCIRLVLYFPRFVWALSLSANHKALFTTTTTLAFTFRETVICLLHFIQVQLFFGTTKLQSKWLS